MLLAEKVALITGGGNGIGRATAVRFANEGARVIIADVNEAGLAQTGQAIRAAGLSVTELAGDVTVREDVQRMVDTAVNQFGRLDILINNAGITRDGMTTRLKEGQIRFLSEEKWAEVIHVNLTGTWLCSQIAAVPMIHQGSGRMVNTASVSALGHMAQANYSASKAGVIALTKTLALEWARYGIAVNCIAPGGVKTDMTAAIPEKFMTGLREKIPFHRLAEPEEIAAVHAFLASTEASYITGQVIFVDGGSTIGR